MPTYQYRCSKCGRIFEVVMSMSRHERRAKSPCPKCGGRKVVQVPTRFQAVTAKKT